MSLVHRFTDNDKQELFYITSKGIRVYLFIQVSKAINDEMVGNTYASSLTYSIKPFDIISIANGTRCDNFIVDKDLYVRPFDGDKMQFIPSAIMPLIVKEGIQSMPELLSRYTVKSYDFSLKDSYYCLKPMGILLKRIDWKFSIQMTKKVDLIIMSLYDQGNDSRQLINDLTVKDRDVNIKTKGYKFTSVYISYAYARGESQGMEVESMKNV